MNISAVISAYNEENKLEDCLRSLDFTDEIIVVNNSSNDNTEKIARKYTDKVFTKPNNLQLNINKNFGFSKAKNRWIINLDADERVTDELRNEILSLELDNTQTVGYLIPRYNVLFGKVIRHGLWYPDYQLRLFRKDKGEFPIKHIHELIEVDGPVEKLKEHIKHFNYESIDQYVRKTNVINTTNEAQMLYEQGRKVKPSDIMVEPIKDFFKNFILQKGYLDGMHGLSLGMLQATYTLLIYLKLWELSKYEDEYTQSEFNKEISRSFKLFGKEFNYWTSTYNILIKKYPRQVIDRVRRKLNS